jgi:NAD+ synthase (glutamine-hydrolysing)
MDFFRVAGAQINLTVGDIDGNTERILEAMAWAEDIQADLLLLPELAVTSYPPEDLLLREAFVTANIAAMHRIAAAAGDTVTVLGFVDRAAGSARDDAGHQRLHNAAGLLHDGRVRGIYHKRVLPNYGVFDEDRYFLPGGAPGALWEINGVAVGVSVCEDIWVVEGPAAAQAAAGADVLVNINGSPYHAGRGQEREKMLSERAAAAGIPLVYLNLVGGQDELLFDGESMAFGPDGTLLYRAPQFAEDLFWLDLPLAEEGSSGVEATVVSRGDLLDGDPEPMPESARRLGGDEEVYRALVVGLGDYARKNGFDTLLVGLSGGIDSALTAAIAADAVGPGNVWGITMPSRFSSEGSVEDSRRLAENLGIRFDEISIEPPFSGFLQALAPVFGGAEPGVAEENLQARARGALLMALSNRHGGMVVATGNKSELAVGYATLYGDMVGGYSVLKDVFKTRVYRLAEWLNRGGEVIPREIIDKPPSAELRPEQRDTDSLPPYDRLDPILQLYIEEDASPKEIVASGFDRETVDRVTALIDRSEYKRRQAAPGARISTKALGRDRRLPIACGFRR